MLQLMVIAMCVPASYHAPIFVHSDIINRGIVDQIFIAAPFGLPVATINRLFILMDSAAADERRLSDDAN